MQALPGMRVKCVPGGALFFGEIMRIVKIEETYSVKQSERMVLTLIDRDKRPTPDFLVLLKMRLEKMSNLKPLIKE